MVLQTESDSSDVVSLLVMKKPPDVRRGERGPFGELLKLFWGFLLFAFSPIGDQDAKNHKERRSTKSDNRIRRLEKTNHNPKLRDDLNYFAHEGLIVIDGSIDGVVGVPSGDHDFLAVHDVFSNESMDNDGAPGFISDNVIDLKVFKGYVGHREDDVVSVELVVAILEFISVGCVDHRHRVGQNHQRTRSKDRGVVSRNPIDEIPTHG